MMLAFSCFSIHTEALPFEPSFRALVLSVAMFMAMTFCLVKFFNIVWMWVLLALKLGFDSVYSVWIIMCSRYMLSQHGSNPGNTIGVETEGAYVSQC